MYEETHKRIFQQGSTTYFNSTLLFPKQNRRDISLLYSFVRVADDYVDSIPQRVDEFHEFCELYRRSLAGKASGDVVIDGFVDLMRRKDFDPAWVDAFLYSMEMDLSIGSYENHKTLDVYLYGSSEVVGLMMAKVMDLPEESYHSARMLGKAMQYINFIRDVDEDITLGRCYFPREEMDAFGLKDMSEGTARANPEGFRAFIRKQISRYSEWQAEAESGFHYIPFRFLVPIKTASNMYSWTAQEIAKDPFSVFQYKIKPSKLRILRHGAMVMLFVFTFGPNSLSMLKNGELS